MRRLMMVVALFAVATPARAQLVVFDPGVFGRNVATAATKELLAALQRDQRRQVRRMARRLSVSTDLTRYDLPPAPRWRTHDFESLRISPEARRYHASLNYGDGSGVGYEGAVLPLLEAVSAAGRLPAAAQRAWLAELATVAATDASSIAGTDATGRLRFNGRKELAAINRLAQDALDPSQEQSATAVLDKLSGSALIGARQRQARAQLLASLVEQLVVESKRERDTEAAALNMQLVRWRDGRALDEAFVAGTGDALRTWRQP